MKLDCTAITENRDIGARATSVRSRAPHLELYCPDSTRKRLPSKINRWAAVSPSRTDRAAATNLPAKAADCSERFGGGGATLGPGNLVIFERQ